MSEDNNKSIYEEPYTEEFLNEVVTIEWSGSEVFGSGKIYRKLHFLPRKGMPMCLGAKYQPERERYGDGIIVTGRVKSIIYVDTEGEDGSTRWSIKLEPDE